MKRGHSLDPRRLMPWSRRKAAPRNGHGNLKKINLELERRGTFVETLLANIAAGVISVNPSGTITTWNKAAEKMLGLDAPSALGKGYEVVF